MLISAPSPLINSFSTVYATFDPVKAKIKKTSHVVTKTKDSSVFQNV